MRKQTLPTALLALLGASAATLAIAACGGNSSPSSTTTSSHTTSSHTTSTHTTGTRHKFHSGGKSGY